MSFDSLVNTALKREINRQILQYLYLFLLGISQLFEIRLIMLTKLDGYTTIASNIDVSPNKRQHQCRAFTIDTLATFDEQRTQAITIP
ncbi:hypothetical protein AB6A40_000755 [Gnathostoma spinigerum]|uniref:Uncharacterized protein n=1 Tax=Gnathostoma spinigerum TaxID=75299 RepID=A0ABD6E3Y6_9BILA